MSKKLEFKPEDFEKQNGLGPVTASIAAPLAQARFDAWLSEQVRVYGRQDSDGYWFISNNQPAINVDLPDTHTALLVCIEELAKKPCEHEPLSGYDIHGNASRYIACKHCGIKLKAKWEVSE